MPAGVSGNDAGREFEALTLGFGPRDDFHSGSKSGLRSQGAVFDDEALGGPDVQQIRSAQIRLGVRLPLAYIVARNFLTPLPAC